MTAYAPRHARTQPRQQARTPFFRGLRGVLRKLAVPGLWGPGTATLPAQPLIIGACIRTIPRKQVEGHPNWVTADFPSVPAIEGPVARTAEEKAETERSWRVFNSAPQLEVAPELARAVTG